MSQPQIIRIINLRENQETTFHLACGKKVIWSVNRFNGRLRLSVTELPDGTRIKHRNLTPRGKIR